MAEHKRANRPGDIPDAESGQSQQNPGGRIVSGKKDPAEDQGGCGSVDEEIVILQRAADPAGDRRLFWGSYAVRLVQILNLIDAIAGIACIPQLG
jgi:hypothetical protein